MKKLLGLTMLLCFCPCVLHALEIHVGSIKTVKGRASIVRSSKPVAVMPGTRVYRNDTLKTGADGSLAMVFRDDTLLSIGPDSEIVVNEFLYSPAEGKLSLITRMLKGTAAYVSGIIGKLAPDSVRFETPVATIGLRGTRFAVRIEEDAAEKH
jgi:hypothetical protein